MDLTTDLLKTTESSGGEQPPLATQRPSKQSKQSRVGDTRGRDNSLGDTPGFKQWVAGGIKSGDSEKASVAKIANVATIPAVNQAGTSEFDVLIEKNYKIRFETAVGLKHARGEVHLVPWGKYTPIVDGLIDVIANVLNLPRAKIRKESDIAEGVTNTAHPAFRLILPRRITENEQRDLDIAFQAFRQHLRGQDVSLVTEDLFERANPEAANAGRLAAEVVRRRAGGRNLPEPLAVSTGAKGAKPIELKGRIGCHPDPVADKEPFELSGRAIGIQTEDEKLYIRCNKFLNEKGKEIESKYGKKFVLCYTKKEQESDVLKLRLGRPEIVQFTVIPRLGRGREQLILKSIKWPLDHDRKSGEDNNNTNQ